MNLKTEKKKEKSTKQRADSLKTSINLINLRKTEKEKKDTK